MTQKHLIPHSSCRIVIRFSHRDTHTHAQQISLLTTVQHDDLIIKWTTIRKVSILTIFMLSRLRRKRKRGGWSCCLRGGRGGRRGRCTQYSFMETHHKFWLFCFFISPKMFLCGSNPSSTVCFSFSAHIIEGPCHKRSQKQSWIIGTLLPDCLRSICFLALLLPCLLPHHLPPVWKRSSFVNSSGVVSNSS